MMKTPITPYTLYTFKLYITYLCMIISIEFIVNIHMTYSRIFKFKGVPKLIFSPPMSIRG